MRFRSLASNFLKLGVKVRRLSFGGVGARFRAINNLQFAESIIHNTEPKVRHPVFLAGRRNRFLDVD